MMTPVVLLLLGGWVALDGAALGQFLIARPLVASSLAGLLVGAPLEGMMVGLLLELVDLAHVPLGGVELPEPGPGAVVAGGTAGVLGGGMGLAFAFTLALLLGWIAGKTVQWHREVTAARLARLDTSRGGEGLGSILGTTLIRDGVRGILLVALGLGVVQAIPLGWWASLSTAWPLSFGGTVLLLGVAAVAGAAELTRLAEPNRWARLTLFVSGAGVGVLLAMGVGVASFLQGGG